MVAVIIINPNIIVFLDPILFLIAELKGANIIYAIENIDIISDIYVFEIGDSLTKNVPVEFLTILT